MKSYKSQNIDNQEVLEVKPAPPLRSDDMLTEEEFEALKKWHKETAIKVKQLIEEMAL